MPRPYVSPRHKSARNRVFVHTPCQEISFRGKFNLNWHRDVAPGADGEI